MEASGSLNKLGMEKMQIAVLGMGHVGIPTALGLAELGWQVTGVDLDKETIDLLQQGRLKFYEPELQELLTKHLQSGRMVPTGDVNSAIRLASVIFVCVGTPPGENGEADLSQLEAAARTISKNLNGYKLVVVRSTVPPGTTRWMKRVIVGDTNIAGDTNIGSNPSLPQNSATDGGLAGENPGQENSQLAFDVASNPEFFQEGKAVRNFLQPDRLVCGVESDRAWEILEEIYGPLRCPLLRTDLNTAELLKHCANAFLATKISFINMVANLCETVGADVTKVAEGIGMDPRIGPLFLRPGIGFGGYCLPKDLRAFIHLAEQQKVDFSLLKEVENINAGRIDVFLRQVRHVLGNLKGKTIGILGLAFKPNTDDIRGAPSARIIECLLAEEALLQLYDPRAMPKMRQAVPEKEGRVYYSSSAYEAARGAHALLVLTEWEEFRQLDLAKLREQMQEPILFDGRNAYDPCRVSSAGMRYYSIGR